MNPKIFYITLIVGFFGFAKQTLSQELQLISNEKIFSDSVSLGKRAELIAFAKKFIGKPYRYASSDPNKGFDCSGFVHFVFNNFAIQTPRSSAEFVSVGNSIQAEDFKIGDVLVFYGYNDPKHIGHVGIICEANGMNSKFIHSSSGKVRGVIISELNSEMYSRRFYKCVNLMN
jgi:cell wall-associated NlpC family hydrolase